MIKRKNYYLSTFWDNINIDIINKKRQIHKKNIKAIIYGRK